MSDEKSYETVEYVTQDGARASMRVFRAQNADAPVLVCMPAMGVRGSYYTNFAHELSRMGLHVVTNDLRGIGSSSIRASRESDFGYHEILTQDFPAIIETTRTLFPRSPRVLVGHSLGGQLSALYLSTNPEAAVGLALIAACNVHHMGWSFPNRLRVLGTALLFRKMGDLLGYVPAGRFGFAGDEARTVIKDWSDNCRTGTYVVTGSTVDYEDALRRMKQPVLGLSFELDRLAPEQSVNNLICKLQAAQVTRRHFSARHPGLEKATHFSWVKRPQAVIDAVRDWVGENPLEEPRSVEESL